MYVQYLYLWFYARKNLQKLARALKHFLSAWKSNQSYRFQNEWYLHWTFSTNNIIDVCRNITIAQGITLKEVFFWIQWNASIFFLFDLSSYLFLSLSPPFLPIFFFFLPVSRVKFVRGQSCDTRWPSKSNWRTQRKIVYVSWKECLSD